MIKVYHNAKCSKSRECLLFLDQNGHDYETVDYLKNPPTIEELKAIIVKLGIKPIDLVRRKETIWTEKYEGRKLRNDQIVRAMLKYPILIERPIIIVGEKAVVARPIEKAKELLR